jgi:hypothetical protein
MDAKMWQIRQLRNQYHGIHEQEQYRCSAISIIAHAPKLARQSTKNAKQYRESGQYYTEQRNQVNYRFRDQTPF